MKLFPQLCRNKLPIFSRVCPSKKLLRHILSPYLVQQASEHAAEDPMDVERYSHLLDLLGNIDRFYHMSQEALLHHPQYTDVNKLTAIIAQATNLILRLQYLGDLPDYIIEIIRESVVSTQAVRLENDRLVTLSEAELTEQCATALENQRLELQARLDEEHANTHALQQRLLEAQDINTELLLEISSAEQSLRQKRREKEQRLQGIQEKIFWLEDEIENEKAVESRLLVRKSELLNELNRLKREIRVLQRHLEALRIEGSSSNLTTQQGKPCEVKPEHQSEFEDEFALVELLEKEKYNQLYIEPYNIPNEGTIQQVSFFQPDINDFLGYPEGSAFQVISLVLQGPTVNATTRFNPDMLRTKPENYPMPRIQTQNGSSEAERSEGSEESDPSWRIGKIASGNVLLINDKKIYVYIFGRSVYLVDKQNKVFLPVSFITTE